MNRKTICAGAVAALALSSQFVHALPEVDPDELEGYEITITGSDVEIDGPGAPGGGQLFTITTSGPAEDLGTITVKYTLPGRLIRLLIQPGGGVHSVDRDNTNSGEVWIVNGSVVQANIGAYNAGTNTRSGLIRVNRIQNLTCNRTIYADIEVLGTAAGPGVHGLERLEVTGTTAEFYTDGSLHGNVSVAGSYSANLGIGTIDVKNGIGSIDGAPIEIETAGDINQIYAGLLADVHISTPTNRTVLDLRSRGYTQFGSAPGSELFGGGWGGDTTFVRQPIGPGGPTPAPEPSPAGSLTCGKLRSFITVRDMHSDITTTLAPEVTDVWKVGDTLAESASITMAEDTLTHQIIIGQQATGGQWAYTFSFTVGELLMGHLYDHLPHEIGGGAAGLVEYRLHKAACVPAFGAYFPSGSVPPTWIGEGDPPCLDDLFEVRLQHYGQIIQPTSVTCAVRVWAGQGGGDFEPFEGGMPDPAPSGWTEVTSQYHTQVLNGERVIRVKRNGTVTPAWVPGFIYWIELQPETIGCNLREAGGPPVEDDVFVQPYTYWFELFDNCETMYDLNMSGGVNETDLYLQLADPRDFNLDNSGDLHDTGGMINWMANQPQ